MKYILCYGDSNTWGYVPGVGLRHPDEVRWTGVAQKMLGADYRLWENGLIGRTTVFDDPWYPFRNGQKDLDSTLYANAPLDLVVLFLGTNDLKFVSAFESSRGADRLVFEILSADARLRADQPIFPQGAKVLLIAPPLVHEEVERINPETLFGKAPAQSREYSRRMAAVAESYENVWFLDAAQYTTPSEADGLHLEPASHEKLGKAIAEKIKEILE